MVTLGNGVFARCTYDRLFTLLVVVLDFYINNGLPDVSLSGCNCVGTIVMIVVIDDWEWSGWA